MTERQLPWGKLLIRLSHDLKADQLEEAWIYVRSHLPRSNTEVKSSWLKLFSALEDAGVIDQDNTDYLKELLEAVGSPVNIQDVDAYNKEYEEYVARIKLLRGQHDPCFIGREPEINTGLNFLGNDDDKIKCLYIHGMTGLGKTKLAQQICAFYGTDCGLDATGMRMVRLNKVTSTLEMGVMILRELDMQISIENYDEDLLFETLCTRKQHTVILLDNADDILCPDSQSADNFKNQLSALLDVQNRWVKFIVTSRYPINFPALTGKDSFRAILVQPLDELDSIKLLRKASRPSNQVSSLERGAKRSLDDQYAKELAIMCGNCPKMLRAVASRLRNGISPPHILEALSKPNKAHVALTMPVEEDEGYFSMGEASSYERDVLPKMGQMINELTPELKEILIRLSVFPSTFSNKDVNCVLDGDDTSLAVFYLDDLKTQWGMLEEEPSYLQEEGDCKWYSMHALVRTSCLRDCYENENSKNLFHDALYKFSESMGGVLDEIAALASTNAQKGFLKLDRNQANIMHYLEIESGCTLDDHSRPLLPRSLSLPPQKSSRKDGRPRSHTFLEKFLEIKKRFVFFEGMAKLARERGDIEEAALYTAWAQDQNIDIKGFQAPIDALTPVIKELQCMNLSETGELALAQCMYVKGRSYAAKPDPDFNEGLKLLEEAKKIQLKYLGDDTMTARTMNSLGSLYFKKGDIQKALDNHLQAWKMVGQVTRGNPEQHFDSPMHIMNIGTCYYQRGNEYMDRKKEKEAKKCYEDSIAYYDRAIRIQHHLGLKKSVYLARYIRNKSLSLFELKRFDEALKEAVKALNMRQSTFDRHPDNMGLKVDVARSYYQVGMCYHRKGELAKEAGQSVDTIDDFKEAEKHYHKALKHTMELGYENRILDYEELKEDYLELTNIIRGRKQKDTLERAFTNFEVRLLDVPRFLDQQDAAGQDIGRLPSLDPDSHFSGESHAKKCRLS